MVKHVIVDGSNIATEGRSKPSLKQLHEAVVAFLEEHPKAAVTVIVDATFGHRIDPKEVSAFNRAVEHNELVTPPAGTVGRGDAFVLSIAEKAGASILSNDSYQEFHGQYKWLFDEGRLIGGKPVPHVGWVFVERLPVRGEKSRMSERSAKKASDRAMGPTRKVSAAAMKPMPVPKTPPPGSALPAKKTESQGAESKKTDSGKSINDIIPFLQFVESHGVGSIVEGIVESYSSHGAYVQIGEVRGYVPLRLLGNPPPRSARDAMKLGDIMTLEIVEIIAGRRSVNLKPATSARPKKGVAKSPAKTVNRAAPGSSLIGKKTTTKVAGVKKVAAKAAAPKTTPVKKATAEKATSKKAVKKSTTKKVAPKTLVAKKAPVKKAASSPVKKKATTPAKAAAKKEVSKKRPATSSSAASKPSARKR
ncbi:MAG: NYN domain-containing protein [Actinomycetota bacterium]